jgi:hypothetical protein
MALSYTFNPEGNLVRTSAKHMLQKFFFFFFFQKLLRSYQLLLHFAIM